jgi:glycine reductase complex component B subunit gamma
MTGARVVHYLNQFFAGVGGEDRANEPPGSMAGAVGPGRALAEAFGERAQIVGTVYCGDNYFNEQPERASEELRALIAGYQPTLVVVGPAFNAGRYGIACGRVGVAVQERLGVPVVTGMYAENPAVELYRAQLYIVQTGATAATTGAAVQRMAALGLVLTRGERPGLPAEEGYIPRGLRFTGRAPRSGAARAVDLLVHRLKGEPFETEWPVPAADRVPPPPPVRDLSRATLAVVTSAGIVPLGNPDRIESTFATKWGKYSIAGLDDLTGRDWEAVHGGYDHTYANEDPDRIVPVDVLRELEAQGAIGRLCDTLYVAVGSGASQASARQWAREMGAELTAAGVDGVILTGT